MDNTGYKPNLNTFSPQPARQPYRRRRIIWGLIFLFGIVFYFGAPWEYPASGLNSLSSISRANIAQLSKPSEWMPDEIQGLLHFVTRDDGRVLSHDPAIDPRKPMRLSVYEKEGNWTQYVQDLEEKYPVIVFSKVSFLIFVP